MGLIPRVCCDGGEGAIADETNVGLEQEQEVELDVAAVLLPVIAEIRCLEMSYWQADLSRTI